MKVPSTTSLSFPTLSPLLTAGKNKVGYSLDRVYALNNAAIKYNLQISVSNKKTMPMKRKINVRTKKAINKHIIEEFI
jgi:hypothetical protein